MSLFVDVALHGKKSTRVPIWFMRQAGRYLPEYINVKKKVEANGGTFLDMCYNPEIASEITLQPIERYALDAAIIFADILVIPDAMGANVHFVTDIGPVLDKVTSFDDLAKLDDDCDNSHKFKKISESVAIVRDKLSKDIALIGFAGCPFTVATYMCSGGRVGNGHDIRMASYTDWIEKLIHILTDNTIIYLEKQILAGADAIQLFESHASYGLNEYSFQKFILDPTVKIITTLKKTYPKIPFILFPRGAGARYPEIVKIVNPNVIGVDEMISDEVLLELQKGETVIQGNIDNYLLCYGREIDTIHRVECILEKFTNKPFIFNAGHGILKDTNPSIIQKVIDRVRRNV